MARHPFGGSAADFLFTARPTDRLVRLASGTLTFHSAEWGGTQYTDLILNGEPTGSIPVGADGQVPTFSGPDGVTQMWASAGGAMVLMVSMEGVAEASATARDQAVAAAAAAATDAAAAQAVGNTNDGIIAGRIEDPASATRTSLNAAIAGQTEALAPKENPAFTGIVTVDGAPLGDTDGFPNPVPNPDFEVAVPLGDTSTTTNWRFVDGTALSIQTVTDGPLGTTSKVLQAYGTSNLATVRLSGLIARGIAGKTMRVRIKARALANGTVKVATGRITVADVTTPANPAQTSLMTGTPLMWTTLSADVTIPATTDTIDISIGTTTGSGSGRMQIDSVRFAPKGASLAQAAEIAITSAIDAGKTISPATAAASFVPFGDFANQIANGDLADSVTLNDNASLTNWRYIDGGTPGLSVLTVSDGPDGPAANVIQAWQSGSNLAGHMIRGQIAGGWAGKTMRLRFKARALVNGAAVTGKARITLQDPDNTARLNSTTTIPGVPSQRWETYKLDYPLNAATDNVLVMLGVSSDVGSARVQFTDISWRLAADSATELAERATAQAMTEAADTYVPLAHYPSPVLSQLASNGKAGVVGTSGKAALAIRFDDDQDYIKSSGILDLLRDRGFPFSIALCSELGSQEWNDETTWDDIRNWNRNYGGEIWSHGTDHRSPWSPDPITFTHNIRHQIVHSRSQIESNGLRCMGWTMPGVSDPGYGFDAPNRMGDWIDFEKEAGRLILNTYGLSETDVTGVYRMLPSDARHGLSHTTVSDGMLLGVAKRYVDGAIDMGQGIELMCHTENLITMGMGMVDFTALLDYILTKRDAGLLEVLTPSALVFANPESSRRLDLISNGDLSKPVPTGGEQSYANWRNVTLAGKVQVATVADSHGGGTGKVLRVVAGAVYAEQIHDNAIGRGLAGQSYMLDAWVRSISGTPSWALTIDGEVEDVTVTAAAPGGWARIRRCFAIPPTTDNLTVKVGATGAGTVEWADVHVWVA